MLLPPNTPPLLSDSYPFDKAVPAQCEARCSHLIATEPIISKSSGLASTSQLNVGNCGLTSRQSAFNIDVMDSTRDEYPRDSPFHIAL
jgi:hypothetical protein